MNEKEKSKKGKQYELGEDMDFQRIEGPKDKEDIREYFDSLDPQFTCKQDLMGSCEGEDEMKTELGELVRGSISDFLRALGRMDEASEMLQYAGIDEMRKYPEVFELRRIMKEELIYMCEKLERRLLDKEDEQ